MESALVNPTDFTNQGRRQAWHRSDSGSHAGTSHAAAGGASPRGPLPPHPRLPPAARITDNSTGNNPSTAGSQGRSGKPQLPGSGPCQSWQWSVRAPVQRGLRHQGEWEGTRCGPA